MRSISALSVSAVSNHCELQELKLYKIIVASTGNAIDIADGRVVIQSSVKSIETQYWSFKKFNNRPNLYIITHNYTGLKLVSFTYDKIGFIQVGVQQRECDIWYTFPVDEQYCAIISGIRRQSSLAIENEIAGNKFQFVKTTPTFNCRQLFRFQEYSGNYSFKKICPSLFNLPVCNLRIFGRANNL